MKKRIFLLDTHALIFWNAKVFVSDKFIQFLDAQDQKGTLHVSSVSFWEIALLVKKGRVEISDMHAWKNEILDYTHIRLIDPSTSEMIDSTLLTDHHKDPFDRLLIAQAKNRGMILVTKDRLIEQYRVPTFWL